MILAARPTLAEVPLADLSLPAINAQLDELAAMGLDNLELEGPVVYSRAASCSPTFDDARVVFAATLVMPGGLIHARRAARVSIGEVNQEAITNVGGPGAVIERLSGSGRAYRVSGGPGAVAAMLHDPSLLADVAVNGAPLVMPAHPECLYVTGDQDTAGQRAVLRAAEESVGRQDCLVGHGLRLEEGGWSPWLPARSHYLNVGYQTLATHAAWRRYEAQNKALIEGRYDRHPPGECFVSSLMPIRDPATGAPLSAATWSKGVRCLLPHADVIGFAEPQLSDNKVLIYGIVPWDTVAIVMGDMLQPQGLYPERYLVKGFPSDEQMAEMKPVRDPGRGAMSRG